MRNAARAVAALLLAAARGGSAETLLEALTDNLIVNGGPDVDSMEGWDDVVNGGDGWNVILEGQEEDGGEQVNGCDGGADSTCENVFQTSYVPCTRRQTVALEVEGKVDAALLDSGAVAVHVHEEVRQFLKVDKYFVRALLCVDRSCNTEISRWEPCKDKHQEEAYQWCETRLEDEDAWRPLDHVFGGAEVVGARYLMFEDGGIDSEYYRGWYGPRFRNTKVSLHAESEPKCDDSCEWSFDGVCDDGTASYDDDDYDDDYAAEPACPLGTDCTDCSNARAARPIDPPKNRCDNKCAWARDGICDDERTNPGLCALGSDCQDCGPIGASNFSLGGGASDDDAWWDDEPPYWDDDYDYGDYQPTKAPTTAKKPAEKPTNQGRGSSKSSKGKAALQPWMIALISVGFAVTFVGGLAVGVACSRRRSRAAKPAEVIIVSLPEKPTTENPPAAPPAIATPVATRNPFDSPPTAVVVHAESPPAYPAGSPPPYQPPRPSDV